MGQSPPLLFETMVFGGVEGMDEFQRRYSTREEAMSGHREAVRFVVERQ